MSNSMLAAVGGTKAFSSLHLSPEDHPAINIAKGFVNEGIDSFRSFFTFQGAVFTAGITILSNNLPRLAKAGLYLGVASGLWNLVSGVVALTQDDGSSPEEAAERMGKGLFYALPLLHQIHQKVPRLLLRKVVERRLKGEGTIIEEDAILESLTGEISDGPVRRMLEPLPPDVRKRIAKVIEEPTFTNVNGEFLGESFFPLGIQVPCEHRNLRWKSLQPLSEVGLALTRLHEGRHLRSSYENYPDLWRYCVERRMENEAPQAMDLLKQFFGRHVEKKSTVREAIRVLWTRDRKKIRQAARFWGPKRVRPEERLCFAEEYRAAREHLGGIDWSGTFERYRGLYYRQRGEANWLQRFRDWRKLKDHRRIIVGGMMVPLAVSESTYLRYRTVVYEHFWFFGYTDTEFLKGAYLFSCLNDRGVTLRW